MTKPFKGYVINLKRQPERLETFYRQPMSDLFEPVEAIDRLDWKIADEVFDIAGCERYIRRYVTLGEIACTLSHVKAWKMIADDESLSDNDYVVIAEDDVTLVPDFEKELGPRLFQLSVRPNNTVDLILLHNRFFNKALLPYSRDLGILRWRRAEDYPHDTDDQGSCLYVIRKGFAKKLVEMNTLPYWLADEFSLFCDYRRILIPDCYLGYIGEDNTSDLENERQLARQQQYIKEN